GRRMRPHGSSWPSSDCPRSGSAAPGTTSGGKTSERENSHGGDHNWCHVKPGYLFPVAQRRSLMSNLLSCELAVSADLPPSYWWPLAFEALRRGGFAFGAPRDSNGHGLYHTFDPEEPEVRSQV